MISDKLLQEKIGWTPHVGQKSILEAQGREVVVCAGRRFGKSAVSGYLALKELLQPDRKVWVVAPSYELSQKVFTYAMQWFAKVLPSQMSGITYRPTPKIRTLHGSTLECKSAENPVSLLGDEMDLAIIDEASRIPRRIYESYLFPALASRKGRMIAISTPKGKNWFYELYVRAKPSSFRFPSSVNPKMDAVEIQRAREMLPQDIFAQEYLAEFLDDAACVFRGVKEIIRDGILQDAVSGRRYLMGVDVAKHTDFTVITIIDTTNNNVVFWDRFNQLDWKLQKARIATAAVRYNRARIVIDSTGIGDPIADDLRGEGLLVDDFRYTSKSKEQLIQKLSILIEQQNLSIPPIQILVDELESFGYNMSEAGKLSYSAPEGLHDDAVNSLALACWSLSPIIKRATLLQEELQKGAVQPRSSFI